MLKGIIYTGISILGSDYRGITVLTLGTLLGKKQLQTLSYEGNEILIKKNTLK